MRRNWLLALLISLPVFATAEPAPIQYQQQRLLLPDGDVTVTVPVGMQLELLSADMDGPRLLTFAANGDLFAGSRSGNVYRITPPYRKPTVLFSTSGYPHNVALREGEMLVAKTDGLYRVPYLPDQAEVDDDGLSLLARLPGGGGHNSRTVGIGPDGRVYVSLGITGNCSDEYLDNSYPFDVRRGGVLVLDETASPPRWQTFASGLRNPVGIDWHPQTKILYASNNGPDHLGFEQPPEVFARLEQGTFMGMPWFQFDGQKLVRDDCISRQPPRPASEVSLPAATFPARNAPMGVAFVPTHGFGGQFSGDAVVALKGSWGTKPSGSFFGSPASRRHPKLLLVRFDNGQAVRVEPLVTGFQLEDGSRWARPTGVAFGADGALYFTSDSAVNGLFRLRKTPKSGK